MKKHKTFKPFDRVLVKQCDDAVWGCKFYSHWIGDLHEHITTDGIGVADEDILPYEGNEDLVGSTDKPDEVVELEGGEYVFVCDWRCSFAELWLLRSFDSCRNGHIQANVGDSLLGWKYAIRFSDFNPNDMEETRKHILCVKNGKIIKYNN